EPLRSTASEETKQQCRQSQPHKAKELRTESIQRSLRCDRRQSPQRRRRERQENAFAPSNVVAGRYQALHLDFSILSLPFCNRRTYALWICIHPCRGILRAFYGTETSRRLPV